jgi:hypothetical protein
MESEIISLNFSYSVTLKFIGLLHTLNRSSIHDFITLCIGNPEFVRFIDFPNVDALQNTHNGQHHESHQKNLLSSW